MAGQELRCNCQANRLLAVVGFEGDEPFIHFKSHKGGRTISEIKIATSARILCTSCERWTTVRV